MSSKPVISPDLLFRLLGYGGLAVVALTGSLSSGRPAWWLLIAALCWPALWWWLVRRWPRLRSPQTGVAQLSHAVECAVVLAFLAGSGMPLWLCISVGMLALAALGALGGWRLLVPSAPAVALVLTAQSRGLGGAEVSPEAVASGMLVASFLLGLALVSFERVRSLDDHRRLALSESDRLRHRNARLARYLPEELGGLIGEGPGGLNRPTDQFVTVAFVDVVGFVELVASRPMAELVDVVNDFISAMAALTGRRGGILSKFLGDGVLIYFPEDPLEGPDQRWQGAVHCARLCLDLGPTLTTLAETWRRRGLTADVHARAGIASGYCAIGDWGGGARLDFTLIGTPVNLASRLQGAARPGGVLVTAATAALIGEDGRLGALLSNPRTMEIKGFGVCRVHELAASANVPASRPPDVTGRHGNDPSGHDISQSLQS